MQCVHLVQKSPEWKAWRVQGITATDTPVILGLSPHKTPWRLWAEKVEFLKVPDLSMVPAIRYGVEKEDVARSIYEKRYSTTCLPLCATYDANPIFRASFDGIDDNGEPVEIKCPGTTTLDDVIANRENSEAYKLYYGQVQHQMLVAEAQNARLIFYDARINDIIVFDIKRDDALIERILDEGQKFYDYVQKRKEPPRNPEKDMFIPRGESVERWMNAASVVIGLSRQIEEHKEMLAHLETQMEQAKSVVVDLIGPNEFLADYGGIAVTKIVSSGTVDYKKMVHNLLGRVPSEAETAPFKRPSSVRWAIRSTGVASQEIIDEEILKEIEAKTIEPVESMWF